MAEAADGEIRRISRDRAGTRLFAGLDEAGNLSREAMASSCAAVKRMADSARSQGAEKVHLFATSATRDAANNADFAALLKAETGLTLEICSGDEEAALSFFGATDGGDSGVIDIGGGSTEIIIGQGMNIRCSFSCQMGAVRLFQRIPIRDHGDLDAVEQIAADILADKLLDYPVLSMPGSWRGTGGTFTTLAAMVKGIYWTDRTYMHGTVLTEADVARFERQLADMTLEQVDQLSQLEPYGAGNPRPVFALLGATVDSVQSVGQGKHLKLRLSKGPSRFDAIFFSMPEAEAHLEPGCRVDAAFYLQANTFRGNTTLQLQLVDLRPSLTPSRHEAESLALLHRLTEGGHLTAQETARLMISRDQFAAFWRVLEWHLKQGKLETELLPYLRTLAAQAGGCDSFRR